MQLQLESAAESAGFVWARTQGKHTAARSCIARVLARGPSVSCGCARRHATGLWALTMSVVPQYLQSFADMVEVLFRAIQQEPGDTDTRQYLLAALEKLSIRCGTGCTVISPGPSRLLSVRLSPNAAKPPLIHAVCIF
jgi:hypothetical protein